MGARGRLCCLCTGSESLIRHLMMDHGYAVVMTVDHEPSGRLATARLVPPPRGDDLAPVYIDLLLASSGIEPEIASAAQALEVLPGVVVPVARPGHLVVLKLLARDTHRPQDELDLAALRPALTAPDETLARSGAALIVDRGYHRDRNLVADLATYLATT